MTSTFTWPRRNGRDKRPEELTDQELFAWKSTYYYPKRIPPVAQVDGPSSITSRNMSSSQQFKTPLPPAWAAAQQAYDAKVAASEQFKTEMTDTSKNNQSFGEARVTINNQSLTANESKATWATAQAGRDATNASAVNSNKQENIPPKRSWGQVQKDDDAKNIDKSGSGKVDAPPPTKNPTWDISQALLHAQQTDNNVKLNQNARRPLTSKWAEAQTKFDMTQGIAEGGMQKHNEGGALSGSRWAVPETQNNFVKPRKLDSSSSILRQAISHIAGASAPTNNSAKPRVVVSETKPLPVAVQQVPPRPVTMKQPSRELSTSAVPDSRTIITFASKPPPHTEVQIHNTDKQKEKSVAHQANVFLPPHLRKNVEKAGKSSIKVDPEHDAVLNKTNVSKVTAPIAEQDSSDRGSKVSKTSAIMNSKWASADIASKWMAGPVKNIVASSQTLRPEAKVFQAQGDWSFQSDTVVHSQGPVLVTPQKSIRPLDTEGNTTDWAKDEDNLRTVVKKASKDSTEQNYLNTDWGNNSQSAAAPGSSQPPIAEKKVHVSQDFQEIHDGYPKSALPQGYKLSPLPWNGPTTMPTKHAVYDPRRAQGALFQSPAVVIEPKLGESRSSWGGKPKKSTDSSASAWDHGNSPAVRSFDDLHSKEIESSTQQGFNNRCVMNKNMASIAAGKECTVTNGGILNGPEHLHKFSQVKSDALTSSQSGPNATPHKASSPSPSIIAIQAIHQTGLTTFKDQGSHEPESKVQPRNSPTEQSQTIEKANMAQQPTPFDRNKYGNPRTAAKAESPVKTVEDKPPRRTPGSGFGSKFDISTFSADAFSKHMDLERVEKPKGKIYHLTGKLAPTKNDAMFGDRPGVQIWTQGTNGTDPVVEDQVDVKRQLPPHERELQLTNATRHTALGNLDVNRQGSTRKGWGISHVDKTLTVQPRDRAFINECLRQDDNKALLSKCFMEDLRTKDLNGIGTVPLTAQQLALATGDRQSFRSQADSFDEKISDTGIGKEDIRGTWGVDAADELLDFDGSRLPAPVDWDGRPPFDNPDKARFIEEWTPNPVVSGARIDISRPEFKDGTHTIDFPVQSDLEEKPSMKPQFLPPLQHSPTTPANGDPVRVPPTALDAITEANRRQKAQFDDEETQSQLKKQRLREIRAAVPEISPFAPSIKMYLRAANPNDAAGIAAIYNYYVGNTIIPEDQQAVSSKIIERCIENCTKNALPFIVAVAGDRPPTTDAVGRLPNSDTALILPQHENIIGFSYAEIYNFGMNGQHSGRSRCNAVLQLYVDKKYQHKGIGRNLMDRMMHIVSHSYGHRNVVPWVTPPKKFMQTYDSSMACRWHSLFFYLPLRKEDDPEFNRTSKFLKGFFFQQQCILKSAARTSTEHGGAEFVDLAIFEGTALSTDAFHAFN